MPQKLPLAKQLRLEQCVRNGDKPKVIARQLGIGLSSVYRCQKKLGIKPNAKTCVDKLLIISMLNHGLSPEEIATATGVSSVTVRKYRNQAGIVKSPKLFEQVKSMYKFRNTETGEIVEIPKSRDALKAFANERGLSWSVLQQAWGQYAPRLYQHRGWVPVFPEGSDAEKKQKKLERLRKEAEQERIRQKDLSYFAMMRRKQFESRQEPKSHPWRKSNVAK